MFLCWTGKGAKIAKAANFFVISPARQVLTGFWPFFQDSNDTTSYLIVSCGSDRSEGLARSQLPISIAPSTFIKQRRAHAAPCGASGFIWRHTALPASSCATK
jgi:hypothetical protein